jgi:hypothetical protein
MKPRQCLINSRHIRGKAIAHVAGSTFRRTVVPCLSANSGKHLPRPATIFASLCLRSIQFGADQQSTEVPHNTRHLELLEVHVIHPAPLLMGNRGIYDEHTRPPRSVCTTDLLVSFRRDPRAGRRTSRAAHRSQRCKSTTCDPFQGPRRARCAVCEVESRTRRPRAK